MRDDLPTFLFLDLKIYNTTPHFRVDKWHVRAALNSWSPTICVTVSNALRFLGTDFSFLDRQMTFRLPSWPSLSPWTQPSFIAQPPSASLSPLNGVVLPGHSSPVRTLSLQRFVTRHQQGSSRRNKINEVTGYLLFFSSLQANTSSRVVPRIIHFHSTN